MRTELIFTGKNQLNPMASSYNMRYYQNSGMMKKSRVTISCVGKLVKTGFCLSSSSQISYSGVRSFDPSVPLQRPGLTVSLPSNTTHHMFSQLHPGVTYQFSIRASTSKGFGPATTLNVTTNISGNKEVGTFCCMFFLQRVTDVD